MDGLLALAAPRPRPAVGSHHRRRPAWARVQRGRPAGPPGRPAACAQADLATRAGQERGGRAGRMAGTRRRRTDRLRRAAQRPAPGAPRRLAVTGRHPRGRGRSRGRNPDPHAGHRPVRILPLAARPGPPARRHDPGTSAVAPGPVAGSVDHAGSQARLQPCPRHRAPAGPHRPPLRQRPQPAIAQVSAGWRSTPMLQWEPPNARWRNCSGPGPTSFPAHRPSPACSTRSSRTDNWTGPRQSRGALCDPSTTGSGGWTTGSPATPSGASELPAHWRQQHWLERRRLKRDL